MLWWIVLVNYLETAVSSVVMHYFGIEYSRIGLLPISILLQKKFDQIRFKVILDIFEMLVIWGIITSLDLANMYMHDSIWKLKHNDNDLT